MRKLVVLCLAAGLALASSEQWIGHRPAMCRPIPNPQPGVFPSTPMSFLGTSDTLSYDDGMPTNNWIWYEANNGWGMKFISPSDNVTLAGALIYPVGGDVTNKAIVEAYTDDGPGGSPGTGVFSDTVDVTPGQWNLVPISVNVVASNFYVFYIQYADSSGHLAFGIDAAPNAPQHRKWRRYSGAFSEDNTPGDWLIRAVLDWTPQDTNGSAFRFATTVIDDTLPDINFPIRAHVKNLGSSTLPSGTPVRLRIAGPGGYEYQDTVTTTAALNHGATAMMNFTPVWHIPNQPGNYNIKVWTEAAGEMYPFDDTIAWDLGCAKWIDYFNEATQWIRYTWVAAERAVQFDPADFSLEYPVGVSRARVGFFNSPDHPWLDTSFTLRIYGDDGYEVLYESQTLEATPGAPAAFTTCDIDPVVVIQSGTFYVAVEPGTGGFPSSYSDTLSQGHSYTGSPGAWAPYNYGEFFMSAAAQGNVGVEEGYEPGIKSPNLRITNHPNPVNDLVTLKWQVPSRMPVSINLYDATGRMVRNLYAANDKARTGTLTVDTKSMAAGIYLVRLETSQGSATHKLVIQR